MRKVANNTFNGGLLMDLQPLTTPNSVLTDCLNGTIITYDGNEFVLQGDDGNCRVIGCRLPKDFIPLGMKEYGGIIYIVSKNPFTGECEIGSFPSPEQLIDKESDGLKAEINTSKFISGTYSNNGLSNLIQVNELGDLDSILRPGDKFLIYSGNDSGDANDSEFIKLCQQYTDSGIERRLFNCKILRISKSGESEDISDIIDHDNMKGGFLWILNFLILCQNK